MRKRTKMLLLSLGLLVYVILKIYVINTPNPHDDVIPDIIIQLLT